MNPTSVQHAALRVLLDEIDPMLQQSAAIVGKLQAVQAELHADLEALGPLVQRAVDAQPALLETGRRLGASAARIEATLQTAGPGTGRVAPAREAVGRRWPARALTALLTAVLLAGGAWTGTHDLREQARIGRALQAAWPALDAAARARLQEVLGTQ